MEAGSQVTHLPRQWRPHPFRPTDHHGIRSKASEGRIFLPSPPRPPLFRPFWARLPAISARVPLSLPSLTKRIGGGGGWRMTLTLFDFEGEQITQITSHLLGDGLREKRDIGRGKAPHCPTPPLVPPNFYAKIMEILATHDQLFWPTLYYYQILFKFGRSMLGLGIGHFFTYFLVTLLRIELFLFFLEFFCCFLPNISN